MYTVNCLNENISDWLRNRNTIEYLGILESIYNPGLNYGEFAIIKSQADLNSYKLSVKEWVEKTNANSQIQVDLGAVEIYNIFKFPLKQ